MSTEAFFTRDGSRFVPTPVARGPWAPDMLHGRLLAGLLARTVERGHGEATLHPTRLTVDLFRSPPMRPLEVSAEVVRKGNRVRVVNGSVTIDGEEYARASVVMLRRAEQPSGDVWSPPSWDAPGPGDLPVPDLPDGPPGWMVPWETRPITRGGFGAHEQKRTWLREVRELVAGEALTPFVRVATAADFANPLANSGSQGLEFINADITLYLGRLPADEWVGFEVARHVSAEGVAIGECVVYDTGGPIGTSTVCSVAQRRTTSQRGA